MMFDMNDIENIVKEWVVCLSETYLFETEHYVKVYFNEDNSLYL